MRPLVIPFIVMSSALPAPAGECGSIVPSVCVASAEDELPGRKVLTLTPTVTPYLVGDSFPVGTRSLLMDPARYALVPSDGSWRYYALSGVVYRVDTGSGLVLEVIRTRQTSHLR